MAGYRQIHTRMWSADQWFADLQPEFKLLFIYLFSNERTSVSGLYELPLRVMAFETGLEKDVILAGLEAFAKANKVLYDPATGVVYVRNMFKYQGSASPRVKDRIKADLKAIRDCALKTLWLQEYSVSIGYIDGRDTVSIGYEEGKDTSSSISISSSISSSISMDGGGMGEETKTAIPKTPREAAQNSDIQLYQQITGRFPGEDDYETIITTFEFLREKHGEKLDEFLKPYWSAWSTRKTKDQRPYSPASRVWYCEWAMQEDIPRANGHEPKVGETGTKTLDVIREVTRRKAARHANAHS
jgi:hypothetical protein